MREVHRSAITPYPAEAMFDLVADIDAYSAFLPWCTESIILSAGPEGDEQEVLAMLGIAQGPLIGRFTTRNRNRRPTSIELTLEDGPFSDLQGEWKFLPLGNDGSKLSLDIRFAFSSSLKDRLLGAVFEMTCNKLVDAFVRRAGQIHG